MFACMQRTAPTLPRAVRTSFQAGRCRASTGLIRYRLRVSKPEEPPDFTDWLRKQVEQKYETDSDFARAASISASAASRLLAGKGTPTPSTLEKIAVALDRPVVELFALAYSADMVADIAARVAAHPAQALHPLARELQHMLAGPNHVVPEDDRNRIETLVEAVLAPYRRYLKRRRRATE